MKKLMIAVGAVMMGALAMAANQTSFAYQGVLRDELGQALSLERVKITFRIYNDPTSTDANNLLWSQEQTLSIDTNGLFNAELGDRDGDLAAAIAKCEAESKSAYVGLTVDGSAGEIRPRQKLIATPIAGFARDVRETRGDFTVNGTTIFKGPVSMEKEDATLLGGNIESAGTLTANGAATFRVNAQVDGALSVGGELSVGSALSVSGNAVSVNGDITLAAGKKVATADGVEVGVPVGCILMWSGSTGDIPTGWALCNGQTVNGKVTPNLCDRFIVGAGGNYAVGATGGTNEVALTKGQMPNHYHLYPNDRTANEFIGNNHNAGQAVFQDSTSKEGYKRSGEGDTRVWKTGTAGGDATDTVVGTDGYAAAHENRPPYYALCYIMKVK